MSGDVIDLYLSTPHEAGLQELEKRRDKQISTHKLVKMTLFGLKNNFFEFNNDVF